jgi:hypothetical protein
MLKTIINNTDYSLKLENYLTPHVEVELLSGGEIAIGYYKPFGDIYVSLMEEVETTLSVEYFRDSWTSLQFVDRTDNFKKSGFISWDRPSDWKKTEINGHSLYWIKIISSDEIDLKIKGINLVFSDDYDLKEAYAHIEDFLPQGEKSFIAYHQEARNYILTYLRNKGKRVETGESYKLLDQFDLHNFNEVRQASKYLCLANIFFNESDNVDDKWYQKARDFRNKYSEAINLTFLSLDKNDDGVKTPSETQAIQYLKVVRL